MKNFNPTKSIFFVCAFCIVSPLLNAQSEEEMEAWLETTKPVEEHKFLEKFAGDWTFESTMWMDPSQPAVKTAGEATAKMILGDRYLQTHHKSEDEQMPFEGMALTAFDKVKKEYLSTWVDNMGTGIMMFRGKVSDTDGTMEMEADYLNPMTNQQERHKTVETIIDEDTYKMEYFVQAPGQEEYRTMEVIYTRK